jgi:hypothetical protein
MTTKIKDLFSSYDKLKLVGLIIKAISGVVGGSLILSEAKPYLTLAILALGAAANEVVSFLKDKENKNENS